MKLPECDCCWCCKYWHKDKCDNFCKSLALRLCECREEDYRPLIEAL